MWRHAPRPVALLVVALALAACATYQMDLDRGRRHYETNQFDRALAIFRVLEADIDSLPRPQQAQYAYLRGMTDYRLAELTTGAKGAAGSADPKRGYRDNARHWLAISQAIETKTPGGLRPEEKERLETALADLNREVYGGAEEEDPGDEGGEGGEAERVEKAPEAPEPEGSGEEALQPDGL